MNDSGHQYEMEIWSPSPVSTRQPPRMRWRKILTKDSFVEFKEAIEDLQDSLVHSGIEPALVQRWVNSHVRCTVATLTVERHAEPVPGRKF